MSLLQTKTGFTLIETILTVVIFVVTIGALVNFIVFSYQNYGFIFQQVRAIREAQRGVETMIEEVREARAGEDGSYLAEETQNSELIFYSDIDKDLETERVRYYIEGNDLIKEIINPQGSPPRYSSDPSSIILSSYVRNSFPVFKYFNGNGEELAYPARKKDTKMMQVYLEINVNPSHVPSSFILESEVELRNL